VSQHFLHPPNRHPRLLGGSVFLLPSARARRNVRPSLWQTMVWKTSGIFCSPYRLHASAVPCLYYSKSRLLGSTILNSTLPPAIVSAQIYYITGVPHAESKVFSEEDRSSFSKRPHTPNPKETVPDPLEPPLKRIPLIYSSKYNPELRSRSKESLFYDIPSLHA